jgi:hypothetical protein
MNSGCKATLVSHKIGVLHLGMTLSILDNRKTFLSRARMLTWRPG